MVIIRNFSANIVVSQKYKRSTQKKMKAKDAKKLHVQIKRETDAIIKTVEDI